MYAPRRQKQADEIRGVVCNHIEKPRKTASHLPLTGYRPVRIFRAVLEGIRW